MKAILYLMAVLPLGISLASTVRPLDDTCLSCICESLSECRNDACATSGGVDYCGPFYIHYDYWKEAGELGEDFKACATNLTCSKSIVRAYMKIFRQDCNNNGFVDCGDYFRIHRRGRYECNDEEVEWDYLWLKFLQCYLNEVDDPLEALKIFNNGS